MPNQAILIKPSSANCNMRCRYCFYYDVVDNREVRSYGFMTDETVEQLVIKAIDYADEFVTFAFQGGEPTLIGLDYYKKFIKCVKQYNKKEIVVNYAIQTNGYVIDEAWAKFFADNDFLVGLSLDGPKDIHDLNRLDANKKGTYNRIIKASQIFDKYNVQYNVLCVVSKAVAKHPQQVYNFYRRHNFQFLQFIPCLDDLGEVPGSKEYSLTPEDYGKFLCKLFDAWYQDIKNDHVISIRMFENILAIILGYPPESCDMFGSCSVNAVIEGDGSVYPCDFYVLDEWRLGNINENTFEEIRSSEVGKKFVAISRNLHSNCRNCQFINICRGGCRRHKEPIINGHMSENYFCSAYKKFYGYTLPRFHEIAKIVYERNQKLNN